MHGCACVSDHSFLISNNNETTFSFLSFNLFFPYLRSLSLSKSISDSKFDENITDSDVLHEIDNFIHRAEMQAYASVLRTFIYKTNDLNQVYVYIYI